MVLPFCIPKTKNATLQVCSTRQPAGILPLCVLLEGKERLKKRSSRREKSREGVDLVKLIFDIICSLELEVFDLGISSV